MDKVQEAFKTLKQAMIEEGVDQGGYAHSWHCNIAMMCYDAIKAHEVELFDPDSAEMSHEDAHKVGNDAASRFMKLCFDIETTA